MAFNYFSQSIEKMGENFLAQKTTDMIRRDAKNRIFKDIVNGSIDYTKYGRYFMDSRFLNQLISTAEEELNIHRVQRMALEFYDFSFPGYPLVIELVKRERVIEYVLDMIYNYLKLVRDSNFDVGYLPQLTMKICKYKNDFSKYY